MSSSTTDPGDRSSAQIEREVEQTRAQLTDTLDTLRDRISPGHLMDQAVEYLRGSGGREFASNLGRAVRDNPVPVVLIGAGLGWLMMSGGGSSGASHAPRHQVGPQVGTSRARVHPIGGQGGEAHVALPPTASSHGSSSHGTASAGSGGHEASMAERASAAAERIGEKASEAYDSVAGAVGSAAEGVSSTVGHVADRAAELGQDARDRVARAGSSAQEGVHWLVHEQPMVLAGIGLAIGAAIGAMLPGTAAENRMMGEASDEVARQAKDVAREGYERAREVAGETAEKVKSTVAESYEATKDRLDSGGPSVSNLGAAVGAAAHDVAKAAREGVRNAADGVRDTMKENDVRGGTKDKAPPPQRT